MVRLSQLLQFTGWVSKGWQYKREQFKNMSQVFASQSNMRTFRVMELSQKLGFYTQGIPFVAEEMSVNTVYVLSMSEAVAQHWFPNTEQARKGYISWSPDSLLCGVHKYWYRGFMPSYGDLTADKASSYVHVTYWLQCWSSKLILTRFTLSHLSRISCRINRNSDILA